MRAMRASFYVMVGVTSLLFSSRAVAQVVMNEFMVDERTAGSGLIHPSTREFVELYNAGGTSVDISSWTLKTIEIGNRFNTASGVTTYTIPASSSISAGGYYVIGAPAVPNVNFSPTPALLNAAVTPAPSGDLFPDGQNGSNGNFVFELRDASATLKDAIAVETFRGSERANLTAGELAFTGGGLWGQSLSMDLSPPNLPAAHGRYTNGRRTGQNGRDFGYLPVTPGATNNMPQNQTHTIPNVDSLGLEAEVTSYYASFVMPRAIDPTNADGNAINPTQISASPQGGKAIIAYDETGGGNVVYSKEYVNKFDLYAYIETGPLNLVSATSAQNSEATTYGVVGTSDPFFGTPNQAGLLTLTSTSNGNTGYGWMIQRVENFNAGNPTTKTVLQLVDFGASGDSMPADHEWAVMKSYDLSSVASGWHRLSVEYNPATGTVIGKNDADSTTFTVAGDYNNDGKVDGADYVIWRKNQGTSNVLSNNAISGPIGQSHYDLWRATVGKTQTPGLVGNFYVGYRDNLGGAFATSRPPTYDMIGGPGAGSLASAVPEPCTIGLAVIGLFSMLAGCRRRAC